jgi:hypothetical protein
VATYSVTVPNGALTAGNDVITLVPASSRRIWVTEFSMQGMGTSSAASEVDLLYITTAGVTGGGALTPSKDVYAPASASTVNTTWGTQPVVGTEPVCGAALCANANGGIYRWTARPGQEANCIGGIANGLGFSLRTRVAGGGNYTVSLTWQEDPI